MRSLNNPLRRSFGFVIFIAVVLFGLLAVYRQQTIADWFRLRNYKPAAAISTLADQSAMSNVGRHLFYINHPGLLNKADFRKSCPNFGEQTIVIGCYIGGQRGINVLRVADERLAGVEQVTASHEMLHAAYERLSNSEKHRVDSMLQDYATNHLQDQRIKATLESYRTTEPGEQLNEMHSIFGTEIANLPADLESYYARYFNNRKVIVAYAQQYQQAFTTRQKAIKQYDIQLSTESKRIKLNTQTLSTDEQTISAASQRLDQQRQSGDIAAYNAGVQPFNAQIRAYNNLLAETKSLIDSYNDLVEKRNAIAAQTVELQQAINSASLPASQ